MTHANERIMKMLGALLRSQNGLHWIGGHVYGATEGGDPFVILYPASQYMKHKVVRVYSHDFKKLPSFIQTENVPADTGANPTKGQAQKAGIYHDTALYQVLTYLGKETQTGREVRFADVLVYPKLEGGQGPSRTEPVAGAPPPEPIKQDPRGENNWAAQKARQKEQNGGLTADDWKARAIAAKEGFDFFTCIAKAWPAFYMDGERAQSAWTLLKQDYDPAKNGAYLAALEAYATQRTDLEAGGFHTAAAHAQAKTKMIEAYRQIAGEPT